MGRRVVISGVLGVMHVTHLADPDASTFTVGSSLAESKGLSPTNDGAARYPLRLPNKSNKRDSAL